MYNDSEFPNQKETIRRDLPQQMPRWSGGGAPILGITEYTRVDHGRNGGCGARTIFVYEHGLQTHKFNRGSCCTFGWNCPGYNLGLTGLHWPRYLKGTEAYATQRSRHYYVRPGYADES